VNAEAAWSVGPGSVRDVAKGKGHMS
jgi:hypothetical protein